MSDERDLDVDVAACRLGVRANAVRRIGTENVSIAFRLIGCDLYEGRLLTGDLFLEGDTGLKGALNRGEGPRGRPRKTGGL